MEYITPQEAAKKWSLTLRSVQWYCQMEKIPGVKRMGHQWLIPKDAQRPIDKRTTAYRSAPAAELYHFPGLAFTHYYAEDSDLSPEEQELLYAQKLCLRAAFSESMQICRRLAETGTTTAVRFGAYCTILYNCIPMGIGSEVTAAMQEIRKMFQQIRVHKEDYRLLLVNCEFQSSCNAAGINDIDISQLSADALLAYECLAMEISMLTGGEESRTSDRVYAAICRRAELSGAAPAQMLLHAAIAAKCERSGDKEGWQSHIAKVCSIGVKEKLLVLLSKYGNFAPNEYYRCLCGYGIRTANQFAAMQRQNQRNGKIIIENARGRSTMVNQSAEETELALLISYEMTNKTIAAVKDMSVKEVNAMVQEFCRQYNCENKVQLVSCFKQLFDTGDTVKTAADTDEAVSETADDE